MKKRLLSNICFIVLFPWTVLAAQEEHVRAPWAQPWWCLGLVVLLVGTLGWLVRRVCKVTSQRDEMSACLQVTRQMVELAPWPVIQIDQQLRIVSANRQAVNLVGRDQLVGCSFPQLFPKEASHPLFQVFQSGRLDDPVSAPLVRKENAPLRLVIVQNQLYGFWYGRPVTAHSANVPEVCQCCLAEESADRMKSEFIANINHEVRTPMNAIIGYTEMLANSGLAPREKRFVETIHKSSMALVAIFNDIMELSKIDAGRLQIIPGSVRLETIIREIEALFCEQAMEKGIHLECRMESHLPKSYVFDGTRLKQVLQNLISNAVKFTSTGRVDLLADGTPSSTQSGCYDLSFMIEDTGIGIPAADQRKIFEVFRQREESMAKRYGGIGLGLTLCSRLVTMMGGRIDLFSAVGEGTRFTVFFPNVPLAEPASENVLTADQPTADLARKEMTILVVDDVDLIKDVFLDFFHGGPHKVVTADTGEQALALASSEHPDIIFMDLNLSGMDGRTVTKKIRQDPALSAIPVIVMTGEALDVDDYRPLFDGFLQKPFHLESLMEIIANYSHACLENKPGKNGAGQDLHVGRTALKIQEVWNSELDRLLHQAIRSGSLADAAALGAAIGHQGETRKDAMLMALGGDLLHFAAEPDILGVDRLLAQLSSIVSRKES